MFCVSRNAYKMIIFAHSKCKRYENRKIQGVALPKKEGLDKNGKAPIMGRITVNRTMAQFSCKLSCTPSLWNPRASRLEGKSKEAVETKKDIEQLLLSIQKAFDVLVEKRTDFEAKDVKEALQGSVKTQTTLLSFVDEHISENSEGRKFIRKEREKTGVEFFVPLHPIAEKILSLYNTTDDSKPVFPLGEKKDIYLDVHTLGMVLGISNKLGFHASRHTFGVLMLNEDIPIGSIAKMMGHADITSTQVYAQVTEQKISNDMDKLIAKRERNKNPMA